jgi:asparagine synthase (glutamine-hydrolysing)
MCGIFCFLNNIIFSKENLDNNLMLGKKRGPDNTVSKIYSDNLYFGFHRLSINGLDEGSNQPIEIDNIKLICNGEIYNYKQLFNTMNIKPKTNSDCEIIIHLYKKYGIKQTLNMLDGVFAFILYDNEKIYVSRDPHGVRPLYMYKKEKQIIFSSELKMINPYIEDGYEILSNFLPGSTMYLENSNNKWEIKDLFKYTIFPYSNIYFETNYQDIYKNIVDKLTEAVRKRVKNTDREVCCLLSGGLDSSLICAISQKILGEKNIELETYSIGLKDSVDLKYAKKVADYLNTKHTEIIVTEDDFINNIENVIHDIESYDTTTVRASIGNYLLGKYISENSNAKVVLNGDGSDELAGGYLYFHACEDPIEFDKECKRLLEDIHSYDVLRSDKCISSHGLEPRTPFLDRGFVQYYLSINPYIRCHSIHEDQCEKYLIRKAFDSMNILPKEVLWRTKEAFSDGVNNENTSWFEKINTNIKIVENPKDNKKYLTTNNINVEYNDISYSHNIPKTSEQLLYRNVFINKYKLCDKIIPYFWMPRYVTATDSSARTLNIYKTIANNK